MREIFRPILAALALARRWPSLIVIAATIAITAGARWAGVSEMTDPAGVNYILVTIIGTVVPLMAGALFMLFLARTLIAHETGSASPLWLKWVGLYLLMVVIELLIGTVGTVAVFTGSPSPWMMLYGSPLFGALGTIAIFPIAVRAFATAAGIRKPRLGATWSQAFGTARFIYLWYAICAILFPILMVYTFANLLEPGPQANALRGNLIQSAIYGLGDVLCWLLAIVAVRRMLPSEASYREVFG